MLEGIKIILYTIAALIVAMVCTALITLGVVTTIHQTAVWIDKIEHYYDKKKEDRKNRYDFPDNIYHDIYEDLLFGEFICRNGEGQHKS